MSETLTGITFKETLSGGFVLGEVDPERGQETGKLSGSALTLHCEITIADLEAFITDPAHEAELKATIDFAPLGTGIESAKGTFNLFKPSDREGQEGIKLMVYRFGFGHADKLCHFLGQKFIHDGSSLRELWEESTRLQVRLYEGVTEEAPVMGAGVVEISISGVADLVKSMRVTGTDSPVKKAEALAKFGKFFLGELWDAYSTNILGLGAE